MTSESLPPSPRGEPPATAMPSYDELIPGPWNDGREGSDDCAVCGFSTTHNATLPPICGLDHCCSVWVLAYPDQLNHVRRLRGERHWMPSHEKASASAETAGNSPSASVGCAAKEGAKP